jgi:hypothetical protein
MPVAPGGSSSCNALRPSAGSGGARWLVLALGWLARRRCATGT